MRASSFLFMVLKRWMEVAHCSSDDGEKPSSVDKNRTTVSVFFFSFPFFLNRLPFFFPYRFPNKTKRHFSDKFLKPSLIFMVPISFRFISVYLMVGRLPKLQRNRSVDTVWKCLSFYK